MPIMTDGPALEPVNKGIDEFHVGRMESLGAAVSEAFADNPTMQLSGMQQIDRAAGNDIDFGQIATGMPSAGPSIADATKAALPRIDIMDANYRVKQAGLAPHLKLPDQPDIPPAQLEIMMARATARREREATMERGPGGVVQGALEVGTSFLVGAVDPLNVASAFIPVMGELRYAKLLAGAGEGVAARAGVRAAVGAAEGAVGQAAIEPIDWMAHTQEGRDFGMADVLHSIMFGAVLGGALHTGGGAISDVYRVRKERPMYPYDLGEPLEAHTPWDDLRTRQQPPPLPRDIGEFPGIHEPIFPEDPGAQHVTPAALAAEQREALPDFPSPAVQIIDDLPQRAREDAARIGIANLIDGEPLRVGEALEAASRTDPRIAESFSQAGLHLVRDEHLPSDGDTVSYSINGADGSNVGFAEFIIDGDTARVLDIASFAFNGDRTRYGDVRNSIGARQMRDLLDQFRDMHPEVKKFTADRVSGARKGGEYDAGLKGNEIEVKLPTGSRRGRAAADPQTWSLYEFLAHEGGLKPDPELEAILGSAKSPFVPGFGPLVRAKGRALDDALRLAKDHGYLFDAADVSGAEGSVAIRDLLDRLAEENSGRKQYRNDQQHATKADIAAALERERHEILAALHDELEASSGQKGITVDPAIEKRVVEIIQKEGEHDVLVAHERAIMEDEERYNAISEARRADPRDSAIPGWDVRDDAGAASPTSRAAAATGREAGRAGQGPRGDAGVEPRAPGAGNRAPVPTQLERDAAWRALSHDTPEFNNPDVIAASNVAAEVKRPPTKLDERLTAAEKADAYAKQMYDMFAERLPEGDRQRLDDLIKTIDSDHEARSIAIERGAACLFGARE